MPLEKAKDKIIEDLRESEKRLEMALQGANLGVWDWHIPSGHVTFNHRWAEIIGHRLDEIEPNIGSWEKLVHPDDMANVTAVLSDHLEGRSPFYRTEHRMKHKNGHYIWVLDAGKVFERDAAGKPVRASGIHLDITNQKQAEADREDLIRKLKQSNQELDQYAHVIAHDMQQPLAAITGLLENLEIQLGSMGDKPREILNTCREAAMAMSFSIEYLLEYASSTKSFEEKKLVELGPLVQHSISLLPYMYPEAESARFVINSSLPAVYGDKTQIERVFSNILGNALKYSDEKKSEIIIDARKSEDFWILSVKDNGMGVDPADKERIFEMHSRSRDAINITGHGIGLAICRKIIEDHGGRIWVESEKGQGSTFFFTLPANPA